MAKKVQPKTLPGFAELLPRDQIQFNRILDTIQGVFELFGFMPIDTPIIERADILLAKAGDETKKQIYRFKKGDNDLALRFDLTVPLARYVAQRYNELIFPFRRYQIGKVFRGERQQKGRFREFYQCDVDVIGNEKLDLLYDAEMAEIICAVFKKLNFGDFTIKINNRKILNGFFEAIGVTNKSSDVLRIIDKFSKIGREEVIKELTSLLDKDMALKVINFVQIKGNNNEILKQLDNLVDNEMFKTGVKELTQVIENANKFGAPNKVLVIDLTISRGLEYYTGTVYETFLNEYPEIGSVCSGGRFDNLAEYYTDKKLPGVGISIGLTRLFYQLKEAGLIKDEKTAISRVLVVPLKEDSEKIFYAAVEAANKLRNAGINTEIYLGAGIKSEKKIKYADKSGIPFVIFIGEEEIEKGVVALKNMETGEQKDVSVEEAIEMVKR